MNKSVNNAVAAAVGAIFTPATHAIAKETFNLTSAVGNKWMALGQAVRAEVKSAASLDKVRPQVLRELIYQNMPEVTVAGKSYTAIAVVDYAVPRKGTESYEKSTVAEKELWAAMQAASATVRGAGSTYYGRVRKYAYSEEYVNPEKAKAAKTKAAKKKAKMKPSAKIAGMIATIIATIQKIDKPDFAVKAVLDGLEAAQKAATAGLPKK